MKEGKEEKGVGMEDGNKDGRKDRKEGRKEGLNKHRTDGKKNTGRKVCVCVSVESKGYCVFPGSPEDSGDQAKLIVGVVAGLLIAAAVVGLIYWLYMKNSR